MSTESLSTLLERRAALEAAAVRRVEDLTARLALAIAYDERRQAEGHDYGCGQRGNELARIRRDLTHAAGDPYLPREQRDAVRAWEDPALTAVDRDALQRAWQRHGRPKCKRLTREDYRAGTPATRRTIRAWRRTMRRLVELDVTIGVDGWDA